MLAEWSAMRLSRRSEYGIRALVDLVRHGSEAPVALATLADRNNLPPKFLEQIMSTLKHGGIVRTTLGAHGGYTLSADPESVSLGRVIRLLDGALAELSRAGVTVVLTSGNHDSAIRLGFGKPR